MKDEILVKGKFQKFEIKKPTSLGKIALTPLLLGIILYISSLILLASSSIEAYLERENLSIILVVFASICIIVWIIMLIVNSIIKAQYEEKLNAYTSLSMQALTVTENRIYGTTTEISYDTTNTATTNRGMWQSFTPRKKLVVSPTKTIDLPINHVSSISESLWDIDIGIENLKVLEMATSSGKIRFVGLENLMEVKSILLDLISNQDKKETKKTNKNSNYEDLKELKNLLDSGIISKEEFEKEKKKILKDN